MEIGRGTCRNGNTCICVHMMADGEGEGSLRGIYLFMYCMFLCCGRSTAFLINWDE